MPLNVMDAHYESFEKKSCRARKSRYRRAGDEADGESFYSRKPDGNSLECLHYALNLPASVVITGCDSIRILDQALSAARSFRPMKSNEIESVLAKTAQAARLGKYELYKTSQSFDGTSRNSEWLG